MIIIIKKKTLTVWAGVILAAIVVSVGVITAVSITAAASLNGKTVVVDAGHGGRDGGVVGRTTGVREADINLAIARNLRRFLETKGYNVVMTRTTPDGLYGMATRNRKLRDMETRRRIINGANPDLVVSIHQNSFPSPTVRGPQVFFAHSSENGETIAQTMQSVLNSSLGSDRIPKRGDFFILECSPYPSLLIESGFLSNPEEERLLISAEYQEKVAFAIFTGIHMILFPDGPNVGAPETA